MRWLWVLIVLAIAGCGDSDSSEPPQGNSDPADLIVRVPPDFQLSYVNLAAARQQLGLPANANPTDRSKESPKGRESELARIATPALPFLIQQQPALAEKVLDLGAVSEATSNHVMGVPGVVVIRTTQPFDEIAQELEQRGYQRDGEVVELDRGFISQDHSVFADAGDGVVVLGWVRETVDRALAEEPAVDPLQLNLLTAVDGIARTAITKGELPDCVRGVASGRSIDPASAEIRIEVEGVAEAKRLRRPPPPFAGLFEIENQTAKGSALTIELRPGRDLGVERPDPLVWLIPPQTINPATGAASVPNFYDCS